MLGFRPRERSGSGQPVVPQGCPVEDVDKPVLPNRMEPGNEVRRWVRWVTGCATCVAVVCGPVGGSVAAGNDTAIRGYVDFFSLDRALMVWSLGLNIA